MTAVVLAVGYKWLLTSLLTSIYPTKSCLCRGYGKIKGAVIVQLILMALPVPEPPARPGTGQGPALPQPPWGRATSSTLLLAVIGNQTHILPVPCSSHSLRLKHPPDRQTSVHLQGKPSSPCTPLLPVTCSHEHHKYASIILSRTAISGNRGFNKL